MMSAEFEGGGKNDSKKDLFLKNQTGGRKNN